MSKLTTPVREGYAILTFRVLLSLIFVVAGARHLIVPASVHERLLSTPFGQILAGYIYPEPLVILAGAGLLAGGLALMLGLHTRKAAIVLIGILIPITITVQLQGLHTLGPLFKNIGLLGGLIYFASHGSPARPQSRAQTNLSSNTTNP